MNCMTSEFNDEIKSDIWKRMCGGIYEGYYNGKNFDFIKQNYQLIQEYEEIQKIILQD